MSLQLGDFGQGPLLRPIARISGVVVADVDLLAGLRDDRVAVLAVAHDGSVRRGPTAPLGLRPRAFRGAAGALFRRQGVFEVIFPVRVGRLASGLGHEHAAFHHLHPVDVARAVWEDLFGADADDELGLRPLRLQRVIEVDRRGAVHPHPPLVFEVDEQHPNLAGLDDVTGSQILAIPVVVRECERELVENLHEPGLSTLVRAIEVSIGALAGDEEHGHVLDEVLVAAGQPVVDGALRYLVGEAASIEAVLDLARAAAVFEGHCGSLLACAVRSGSTCGTNSSHQEPPKCQAAAAPLP